MTNVPSGNHAFFVSVHIPKTAGTTLGVILNRVFRYRVLMDYPSHTEYTKPDPLIQANRSFVSGYFKGIHGHFNVRRHLGTFPDARFIATVRHPVEQIISQYLHELNDAGSDSYFHEEIRSGRMSVVDFAEQDGIGNAMTSHLEGMKPDDFDLLILTEDMISSLHILNYVIGNMQIPVHFGSPPDLPYENTKKARSKVIEFDEATKAAIFMRCPQDNEIYRKATELLIKKRAKLP